MKSLTTVLLPPLSLIYRIAIRARLSLFERGVLSISRLDTPVISIGNITTGGTGKTPLVEWVCRTLAGADKKVCILTRGYGRPKSASRVVVSDGTDILADQVQAGDEPFLLAEKLLGLAAVISDRDRFGAGQWARRELGTEVFVLDDGFQHLRLFRDLNIVTIDATNPWGGGNLFPYGRLREPLSGLKRADCVVITRADQVRRLGPLRSTLEEVLNGKPIVTSSMRTAEVRSLTGVTADVAAADIVSSVAAFCGIGNSDSFFSQLKHEGYELVLKKAFPDHHVYTQQDVDLLMTEAKRSGVRTLFTTAKDAVKLRSFKFEVPTMVVEIEPVIDGDADFRALVLRAVGIKGA